MAGELVDSDFYGSDKKNYVKFYDHPVHMAFKSEQEGREIIEMQPYVLIVPPGQNKTEVRAPVQERHKQMYPDEWKAYLERKDTGAISGTPIENLQGLPKEILPVMKSMFVHTVEQLASVSDHNLPNLGQGALKYRDMARAFISKSDVRVTELESRVKELEAKLGEKSARKAA